MMKKQSEKRKVSKNKYKESKKGIVKAKKYQKSDRRKASQKKYNQSEKGMENNKKSSKKFGQSEAGIRYQEKWKVSGKKKASGEKWRESENGKVYMRNYKRMYARKEKARRRGMKYIELMENPFPGEINIAQHHINDFFVIPIPSQTHSKNSGKQIEHRYKCNNILNKLGFKIENFIGLYLK